MIPGLFQALLRFFGPRVLVYLQMSHVYLYRQYHHYHPFQHIDCVPTLDILSTLNISHNFGIGKEIIAKKARGIVIISFFISCRSQYSVFAFQFSQLWFVYFLCYTNMQFISNLDIRPILFLICKFFHFCRSSCCLSVLLLFLHLFLCSVYLE